MTDGMSPVANHKSDIDPSFLQLPHLITGGYPGLSEGLPSYSSTNAL